MTVDMLTGSHVTESIVTQFRRLSRIVFGAGALAGLVLFFLQYFFLVPRIEKAEVYERAGQATTGHEAHEDEGWKPAEGWERTLLSAISALFTGIGFAAVLISLVALSDSTLDVRRGILLGAGAFLSVVVAPSLGLPPELPGVPVADLYSRQLWWISAAVLTAAGLYLLVRRRGLTQKIMGVICLVLPQVISAPRATGAPVVPEYLIHEFALFSIAVNFVFWLVLGTVCGFLFRREFGVDGPGR
jgi:cobalt transporter subunit CbtA